MQLGRLSVLRRFLSPRRGKIMLVAIDQHEFYLFRISRRKKDLVLMLNPEKGFGFRLLTPAGYSIYSSGTDKWVPCLKTSLELPKTLVEFGKILNDSDSLEFRDPRSGRCVVFVVGRKSSRDYIASRCIGAVRIFDSACRKLTKEPP